MSKIEINIDNYLSFEEKKEIATQVFKEQIYKCVIEDYKNDSEKRKENYERIISNSVFSYLAKEIDTIIDTDTKELIKQRTISTIKRKDYNYSLFRRKGMFETEDSPAQLVIREAVREHKDSIKQQFKDTTDTIIKNMEVDTIQEIITDTIREIINDKLKS